MNRQLPIFLFVLLLISLGYSTLGGGTEGGEEKEVGTLSAVAYPTDKEAYLFDKLGQGLATMELANPTTKDGKGELYLSGWNCEMFKCSLYVPFTPVKDFDTSYYSVSGKASSGIAKFEGVSVLSNWTETVKEPTYSVKEVTNEYTTIDNKTGKNVTVTEKYNETYQSGTKDVIVARTGYVKLDGTLVAGKSYLLKFDFTRTSREAVDIYPVIGGTALENWAWWDFGYLYKIQINLTSGVNSTLTNFPAYFIVNTSALISAGKMQGDCDDGVVVNSFENATLSYELEAGTCNTTATVYWVKVPSFYNSSTANTVYLYYGNPSATAGNNTADVWSNNYSVVYHFGTNDTLIDSVQGLTLARNTTYGDCPTIAGKFGNGVQMQNCVYFVNGISGKLPTAKNASMISYWENFYGRY
jgi:hypothetical protein